MRYVHCEQGSPEWHRSRAGLITASMFACARGKTDCLDERQQRYVDAIQKGHAPAAAARMAGYEKAPTSKLVQRVLDGERVGRPSESALNYAFRLAIERISGEPLDEGLFETFAMRRGHELEPVARARHMAITGHWVERVGFVTDDEGIFGASLDGVIDDDGAAEYKAFLDPAKLRAIWIDGDIGEIREQAMGGLWLTGRQWMEVCLYCPALAPAGKDLWIQRFERDEKFIEALEVDMLEFKQIVDGYEATLRAPRAEAANAPAAAAVDDSWPFPQAAA